MDCNKRVYNELNKGPIFQIFFLAKPFFFLGLQQTRQLINDFFKSNALQSLNNIV